jgi:hypothetical protein
VPDVLLSVVALNALMLLLLWPVSLFLPAKTSQTQCFGGKHQAGQQ